MSTPCRCRGRAPARSCARPPELAGVQLTLDQQDFKLVAQAIRAEADGRKLVRELNKDLKAAAAPAVVAAKASIMAMPTQDAKYGDMRQAIASKVTVKVSNASGKSAGVNISLPRTGYPRGFANAPRRFNAPSFRHPVFGSATWVSQTGKPGWFTAASEGKDKYVAAIREALERMAERIAARHQ